jgi:hypothetical protein
VARLSEKETPYERQLELAIDNYERVYVAAREPRGGDDALPDTLWLIPPPREPRGSGGVGGVAAAALVGPAKGARPAVLAAR